MLNHPLDKINEPGEYGDSYDVVNLQASTANDLTCNAMLSTFCIPGERTQNRSDKTIPRLLLSSNPSENHARSSEKVPPCPVFKEDPSSSTLLRPGAGQRLSGKMFVGLPRPTTFKRQEHEQRQNLTLVEPTIKESRYISKALQRPSIAVPSPPRQARRGRSVPIDRHDAYPSIDRRIRPKTLTGLTQDTVEQVPPIEFQKHLKSLGNKYRSRSSDHTRHDADIERQSPMKSSMHHSSRASHTKSKQHRLHEPSLKDLEAKPRTIAQPKTQYISYEDLVGKTPLRSGPVQALSGGDSPPLYEPSEDSEVEPEMLLQPDTRPISREQLVSEVKGIYAGLVMVEAKCIEVDEKQSVANASSKVNLRNDQWQSLVALHKQLLHEHHDFFLASQHPSASPALSRLSAKYSMPARMWRHGIHAFLEVLRHRLPESLEHMLAFIYIAYSMIALLYETISTFEDTWIECLGELGRYRMAVEDDEPKDREAWGNVARFWYNKAADKSPNVGRLYHHLAILARPYTLEQLKLYLSSLTCVCPSVSAKGSILTLFNPTMVDDAKINTPFEHKVDNATNLKTDLLKPTRELYGPLLEDFVICGHFDRQRWAKQIVEGLSSIHEAGFLQGDFTPIFSGGWLEDVMIDIDERWDDFLSMAQRPSEGMLRLGVQINSVSWRKLHAKSCSRIGQYAALLSNGLRRRRLSLNSSLIVSLTASWLPAVKGSPMGNPDKAGDSSIMTTSVHLLVGSLYVGFAAAALATAHSLATRKGPIRVWGSMMGISAYGWWAVKNDATASSTLSITNLGVWAVSAFQYGNVTFREFRIPERFLLITLLGALMLDLAIVKFITPSGAPISQSDLISLSLPAMSLSLAITANLFACFGNQPSSPATSHETDIEGSASRVDPYIEGSFQQRTTVLGLDTSRLYLLGSPLHEDSTRIWETDD